MQRQGHRAARGLLHGKAIPAIVAKYKKDAMRPANAVAIDDLARLTRIESTPAKQQRHGPQAQAGIHGIAGGIATTVTHQHSSPRPSDGDQTQDWQTAAKGLALDSKTEICLRRSRRHH